MLASPRLSATSLAGQPRPGAPAWAADWAQLGEAQSGQPRALTATARGSEHQVPRPWAPRPLLHALPGLEAHSSPARDAGAGRTAFASRCPVSSSHFPSPAPEAETHAWVQLPLLLPFLGWQRAPAPPRVQPGLGQSRKDSPLEFGVPHLSRPPGLVRCRCCCKNHFKAAQPVPRAPVRGGGGGAARTGTGKEVTFKPRAPGDREEGWGDGGERCAPGRPRRALADGRKGVKRRSSNKNID